MTNVTLDEVRESRVDPGLNTSPTLVGRGLYFNGWAGRGRLRYRSGP